MKNSDLKLPLNTLKVLERRYLLKDNARNIIETPLQLFRRVSRLIAKAEDNLKDKSVSRQETEETFFKMMHGLEFMPNSPTLMNAGTKMGQLSACFCPDQTIITKNGPVPIKDIDIGDEVLTHRNRFRKVLEKFERTAGSLYTVGIYKLPKQTLKLTAEHPVFVIKKRNDNIQWLKAEELCVGDYVALNYSDQIIDRQTIEASEYLSDRDLVETEGYLYERNVDIRYRVRKDGSIYTRNRNRSGKISKQVIPIKSRIEIDASLMRLFGYYFSEGCVSDEDVLRFTFSEEEKSYAQDVIRIVKNKFGVDSRIEYTNSLERRWISLRFHSKLLSKLFLSLFGTGYSSKTVPDWFITLPIEKQKGFLSGLFRGDSCIFKNGNNFSTKLVMCNTNVVYAAWQMLMRLGHFAALNFEHMSRIGRVRPVRCQVSGKIGSQIIAELLDTEIPHNGIEYIRTIKKEGRLFSPIEYIEKQPYQGKVYNLEVEEDHSYSANFVSVHNCFVLPVADSIPSIFETLEEMALIHQTGGGTGFDFSHLRPKGDLVYSTKGEASGPVSFMSIYDAATGVIVQGGRRRGANMGILRVDHPDILEFIEVKLSEGKISNFNLSVAVTDEFMQAFYKNKNYWLVNPRTKKKVRELPAREVFDHIVNAAWRTGDPGLVFVDEINRHNPTPGIGRIEATNPCGELPLLPYESCNLASLNLTKFVTPNKKVNWRKLSEGIKWGVRFLDNVIEVNKFPLPQIKKITFANRKIGLGIMGFADMLILLGMPYNSRQAVRFAGKLMRFVHKQSHAASVELAKSRGVFPNFKKSVYAKKNLRLRNATVNTIAPTGTISIIAGCSSGIEPLFALSFVRNVLAGTKLFEINPLFEKLAKERGFYRDEIMVEIAKHGSIQKIKGIPADIKKIFITAFDVSPEEHLSIQAAFQKYTDNSVSKTINLPEEATVEEIKKIYLLAHKLKCKGITVYRYGTKKEQVLSFTKEMGEPQKLVQVDADYSGGCASAVCA